MKLLKLPAYFQIGEIQFYALLEPHRHVAVNIDRPSIAQVKYDPEKENSPVYDEVLAGSLHYKIITKDVFVGNLRLANNRLEVITL